MTYNYDVQKQNLFTEEGVSILFSVKDQVEKMINTSGAFLTSMIKCNGPLNINLCIGRKS